MNKEEYLFTCLAEEASEISHAVGKILRFGLGDQYKNGMPNDEALGRELNDLMAVVELLKEEKVFVPLIDRSLIDAKKAKVIKYMEYSRERGCLTDS